MNGLLIVDKPVGASSFEVVRLVRRLVHSRRVGHAGTLDPTASGVLPIAIGWATRLVEFIMAGDKVYRATMRLGTTTDTQDAEGQILEEHGWQHIDGQKLHKTVSEFVGVIKQKPPMYSAIKRKGQPLYKLARQGIEVDREARPIQIKSLVVDEISGSDITFTVQCTKGTYIRTLCHDIGQSLGCGAHLIGLRRLACGSFDLSDSYTLSELEQKAAEGTPLPLLSPAEALKDWAALDVRGDSLSRLQNGVAPELKNLVGEEPQSGEKVRLMNEDNLVAIAKYSPGPLSKRPGDFEILKVFPYGDNDR